jgi:peptidoglycan/xylan/chitin deacetylase (PgdA/CDA1 family)
MTSRVTLQTPPGVDASPLRLPTFAQPSQILTELQSGHGWTNNAGSTIATETTDFIRGSQSVKITTGGAGAQANLSKTGMSSFDASNKAVRLRFKVLSGFSNMAEIGFFLGSSSFANFYKWSIQVTASSRYVQPGEWCTITLSWHDATSSGTPNRAALTDGRFYVIDNNTGNQVAVLWQSAELVPDGSATWANGVISICFDDVYASQWTGAKPTLDARGYPASAYVIGDYIGTAGRLTLSQLQTLQDSSGWEIAGHASTGTNHTASYTGLTAASLESDIRTQRAWLNSKGLRGADGTAYPLGQYGLTSDSASTLDIVRAYWGYARTTHSRTKETFPPADRYRLRAISSISTFSGGVTPSSITTATTGEIDKCKANKSWLIMVFHDLTAGAPAATTQCQQSDFDAIVAAIAAAGVPVRTVADVLRTAV